MMRALLGLFAIVLLGVCLVACGEAGKNAGSSSARKYASSNPPGRDPDMDNDAEANVINGYDRDDASIRAYGQAAGAADTRAITTLVKAYYGAAAAANGARACSLMYSLFAEAIPEDFGRGAGPVYARGNSCPVVMSKLFKHMHSQLATPIAVTGVRISGNQARALIATKETRIAYLPVKRERGTWKVNALVALTT